MKDNVVILHFHSKWTSYFDISLWQWREGELGRDHYFNLFDSFGVRAHLAYPAEDFVSQVSVLIKNRDWSLKTVDYHIRRKPGLEKTEVWIVDGDPMVYYSRQAAVSSPHYRSQQPHAFDMAINSQSFDREWGFSGWLGFRYQKDRTSFRLWAPTAELVELVLYDSTDKDASVSRVIEMTRGMQSQPDNHLENTRGVWFLTLEEDLNFQAYSYRIRYRKRTFKDSRDPYSIAVTADGRRSVVVSPEELTPASFTVTHGAHAPWRLENPNKAVICEMHIRDFSKSETSGVSQEKRGKFTGAYEVGTVNDFGDSTGIDYIKQMGYNYVQLQPVFDHHQTILEDGSYAYNWGYDPENYNVPEASFASNPDEPATRILELKQLIQAYHEAGIGVILDVVYNHTYSSEDSAFQLTVPDYYYRMNPDGSFQDGSGCGNETASEKEMFRKYMIDSLTYWVTAYGVDGFRFDLMGLHDVVTMNAIRSAMDKIDPNILLYGEGWDMGTGLMPEQKAKKVNAAQMPRIGFFNDDARDAIKGAEVYGHFERGFVSGEATEDVLAKAFLGSDELNPYVAPNQVVNYVEAHDNYNLNDLMWELHPDDNQQTHVKRIEMATAMNVTMQGICFMQLGQEFLRTKLYPTGKNGELTQEDKERAMNSYNAPDNVNQINWNLVTHNRETVEKVKQWIALKKKHPYLSLASFEKIRKHVFVAQANSGSGTISVVLDGESSLFFNNDAKISQIMMQKNE